MVAIGRHHGHLKDNATALEIPFVHVWRFRDGKAVQFREYADPGELVRAQGQ